MRYFILILTTIICIKSSGSQQVGTISGEIVDLQTQAFIKDVIVKLIGTNLSSKTNNEGKFEIMNVPVGTYEVQFSNVSYQSYIEGNVVVSSGTVKMLQIELKSISTEEIVIEESKFQKPIDITTSYKTLTYEELRRAPGGLEDIGRVIQTLPGVAFSSDGRNDLIVRGGSPSENLFLVDGFTVNNINHFGSQGATGGPVSLINLDLINEVNFLTGGFSARFGDKLSSVIDIKLRDGNTEHFYGKINLSGIGFGVNAEGPLPFKNQGSWLVSARRSYLDLVFKAAGFSFVPEYSDFQMKLHYHLNKNNFLTFCGMGALDKVIFNNSTEQNKQDNQRLLTNNQNSYSAGLSLKTLINSKSYSLITFSRNYTDYFFSQRDSGFNEIFRNSSKEGSEELKAEYFLTATANTYLSFGAGTQTIPLEYDINKASDTLDVIDPVTGNKIIIPGIAINEKKRTSKAFAYAEATQNFLRKFKLTLGLRYDYFALINKKNYVSPRLSFSYAMNSKISFNLAWGIFYESPSYVWIAGAPNNNSLSDIRADHYIAGIEYLFDAGTKLTIEGYYKNYRNYPVSSIRPYLILANNGGFDDANSFGLESLQSSGKGRAYGFEVFLQKTLTKSIYGNISISYCDARYRALDGVERRSDYDNKFVINIGGGYKLGNSWEFSSKFRVTGGRPYTPLNPSDGSIIYSHYNSLTLPVYHRLDVRVDKRWFFKSWTLTTYVDIENVYNRQNVFEYRWDPFKKQIVTDKNLGILPTIGVSAEF
jgi:outer membrane receptor for ferrienterochelin and colicin